MMLVVKENETRRPVDIRRFDAGRITPEADFGAQAVEQAGRPARVPPPRAETQTGRPSGGRARCSRVFRDAAIVDGTKCGSARIFRPQIFRRSNALVRL